MCPANDPRRLHSGAEKENVLTVYQENEFQGVSVILKAAVGSLTYEMALVLRTLLFFSVFLIFSTGNVICALRLLCVIQAIYILK